MDEFAVSRTTVRQALGDLVSMGYLVRKQGLGTYVADDTPMSTAAPLYGFLEELRQSGRNVTVINSAVHRMACPPEVAEKVGVKEGSPITFLSRTVQEESTPVFYEHSYFLLPYSISDETVLQNNDLFLHSVYAFFEQQGVRISRGTQSIRAEFPTREDVRTLHIEENIPVLVLRRVTYDETGSGVEYSEVRYSSEAYQYQVTLQRASRQ